MHQLKDLSVFQKTLLPSEKDVLEYERIGWYQSPIIIEDELLDQAVKGCEEYYQGMRDYELKFNGKIAQDNSDSKQVLKNNEFICFQKKEIQQIVFHPMISAIAAKLSRTSEVRLLADSLLKKAPKKDKELGIVGWHTDKAYWPTLTSDQLVTAWIPLQDCTVEMGPVVYIDESHQWRHEKELKSFYSFNNQDLTGLEKYIEVKKPNHNKTAMTLKRGQVSFHSCHTIHCSYPNYSNQDRLAIAVHLQDKENTYKKAFKQNGEPIVIGYDEICSKDKLGEPNYNDAEVFPVLFKNIVH